MKSWIHSTVDSEIAADDSLGGVAVVVPVYNASATIDRLMQELVELELDGFQIRQLILVDDGSIDESWSKIVAFKCPPSIRTKYIRLRRNFGQHNATICGLRASTEAIAVTLDDDLQHAPSDIQQLLTHLKQENLDLVYGSPSIRQHARFRNMGAAVVLSFYRRVFRSPVTPTSFRAIRREVIESLDFYNLNFTYLDGLLAWCTNRIGETPVSHRAREAGTSGYNLGRLLLLALNLYTNFSLLPLQVVSVMGIGSSLFGLIVGAYYLLQFFTSHITVPGYASTIVAILVLGGIQLLALGVMGEYLGRLHLNVNRKPQYVVRELVER